MMSRCQKCVFPPRGLNPFAWRGANSAKSFKPKGEFTRRDPYISWQNRKRSAINHPNLLALKSDEHSKYWILLQHFFEFSSLVLYKEYTSKSADVTWTAELPWFWGTCCPPATGLQNLTTGHVKHAQAASEGGGEQQRTLRRPGNEVFLAELAPGSMYRISTLVFP